MDRDELPNDTKSSQLVDLLMHASPFDLKQLDDEIAEQEAYLARLKKSRKLIAVVVGATYKEKPRERVAGEKGGRLPKGTLSKVELTRNAIAKALRKLSPQRSTDLLVCTEGIGSKQLYFDAIKSDWFEKTEGGYQLSAKGKQQAPPH